MTSVSPSAPPSFKAAMSKTVLVSSGSSLTCRAFSTSPCSRRRWSLARSALTAPRLPLHPVIGSRSSAFSHLYTGSERILLGLEDANAFVVSLDSERTWFRYHRLFGDLLRLELRRRLPDEVPVLHRRAAEWFTKHGQVVDAIRHTQAAGDWPSAARLLADHSFSRTLDGQAQTIQALVRAFPPGAGADPELALVCATGELVQGHLSQAAAHLAVAKSHAETTTPDRQRRLRMATASVQLWLARRRAHFADVVEQAGFLASPVTGQSDEDIALSSDLRAAALMNLGTVQAWSLAQQDAERHLKEGAVLAREISRPYLEVGCLAELGSVSEPHSFETARRHCHEAIALAERHGWGAEPVIAPALSGNIRCAHIASAPVVVVFSRGRCLLRGGRPCGSRGRGGSTPGSKRRWGP